MPDNYSLHFGFEQTDMLLPIESDFELLAMDEHEYTENILLASFDHEDTKQQHRNHDSHSTTLTEDTGDDHEEFLGMDHTPAKLASESVTSNEDSSIDAEHMIIGKEGNPGELDVLCGQSRSCASHSGNQRFQNLLDRYAPRYDAVNSKQEKMALTKEIVSCIQASGGRFLRLKDGEWQEISTVTARDKVSHALRTKVASWKRQQQQQKSDAAVTPSPVKSTKKPTHRGRRTSKNHCRQRSSSSSTTTSGSDIVASSFDGNDPTQNNLIDDLLKTQREIFANLQKNSDISRVDQHHPLLKRNSR